MSGVDPRAGATHSLVIRAGHPREGRHAMATVQPLTFGALLKRHRRLARLSQAELAERAGFSVSYVSQLERGERTPVPTTVELIAEALGIETADREVLLATIRGQTHRATPVSAPDIDGSPRLFGRAREIAELERFLAGEGPPVRLLVGEPGIGKTRLLRESEHLAARAGFSVLSGTCHRASGREPYAPMLEAIERRTSAQPLARLRTELEGCAWLCRLLPELGNLITAPPSTSALPPEQERRLMFSAAARFLENIAGRAGTLLVLDDLQWVGPDGLDLLASLVRSRSSGALRVLGAYRDTDVGPDHALPATLLDLVREGLARRVPVKPIEPADAACLLEDLLGDAPATPADMRAGLLRRTGGIPFFLVNCAQALHAGVLDGQSIQSNALIPWDVSESVRQRVAALSSPARDLVAVAAVAGGVTARTVLLRAVADAGDGTTALEALDAAVRARLLAEEGDAACRVSHDLVAEVVKTELTAARRATLHHRIAQALEHESSAPPAEVLAYHYIQAGDIERALGFLERASDRAVAICAYGEAERHTRELIALLRKLGRDTERLRAMERLAATFMATGRYDEALAALAEAMSAHRDMADAESMARVAAEIAQAHTLRGTPEEGITWLQRELRALETRALSSAGLARLYIALANLQNACNENLRALAAADRGAQLARTAHDDRLLVRAERRRGNALLLLGRIEESLDALEAAIPLAEALGDLTSLWGALNSAGAAYASLGEYARTGTLYLRAFAVAERIGDPTAISFLWFGQGEHAFATGEWDAAHACFDHAAAALADVPASRFAAYPPLGQGMLALARGREPGGLSALAHASELAGRHGDRQALRWTHSALAEHELLDNRPEDAHARLAPLLANADAAEQDERDLLALGPLLAWASLDLGDHDAAAERLERVIARGRSRKMRPLIVTALRVRALVAARQGRATDALNTLEDALAMARAMTIPYAEAKLLYVAGLVHSGSGEPARGRERLEAARAICARLGERMYGARIEQALARAGLDNRVPLD